MPILDIQGSECLGGKAMFDLEKNLLDIFKEIQNEVPSDSSGKKVDAYTVMYTLARGNRPARTLKALLKNTDKVLLANTADALSLDVGENPARAELEASIYRAFLENNIAKSFFNDSEGELIDLLVDIHEEGDFVVPVGYGLLDYAPGLMAYHIIAAWIDEDENLILRLPKEIARQFEEHMLDMKSMLDDMFADIDEAAVAAVELYGIMTFSDFASLLQEYGITELPQDLVREGLEQIVAQEDEESAIYKLDGEYLMHAWMAEDDEIELLAECKARIRAIPRKAFPKADFLKFADPAYTDLPLPWTKLREFIERYFPGFRASKFDFDSLFVDLRGIIKLHYPIQEYLELFKEIGVDYEDLDQADVFVGLIQDVHNNTRLWSNRGFTPLELAVEKAGLARSARQMPLSRENPGKTGRNSPCPCGSGKKYKNCCGALQN